MVDRAPCLLSLHTDPQAMIPCQEGQQPHLGLRWALSLATSEVTTNCHGSSAFEAA